MKAATILGIPYLDLEEDNDYHLCLAHLLAEKRYKEFFREKARRGDTVIMDNGVVETGLPMEWSLLKELGEEIEATKIILPDKLYDMTQTLKMGENAIADYAVEPRDLMAVPHGRNFIEWRRCLKEMLQWPITTIGISKFVGSFMTSRVELLEQSPELSEDNKHIHIHILGCLSLSDEVVQLQKRFPNRIDGIDSGIAAIATQAGLHLSNLSRRLDIPLDFFTNQLDEYLLNENVTWWRAMCKKEDDNE